MFLIRFLRRIVIAALSLFVLLWIVLAGFRYPNPIQVAQVGFASPTDTPKHMNSNPIAASTSPKPLDTGAQETLPQTVVFRGKTVTFDEYLVALEEFLVKTYAIIYQEGFHFDHVYPTRGANSVESELFSQRESMIK
jgi:hypothetical protein